VRIIFRNDILNLLIITGMPKGLSFNDLKASLTSIPGVEAVHDLHVWSLTVGTDALSVHLVIGNYETIILGAKGRGRGRYGRGGLREGRVREERVWERRIREIERRVFMN
jgi:hypothetical protein